MLDSGSRVVPRAAVVLGALGVLAMFGGCSLGALDGFIGDPPPDGGPIGSPEGGGGDGPVETDGGGPVGQDAAPDAGLDAGPPNLLTNGDFELGCAGFEPFFGFTSESSTARSGAGSCKFCMDTNWEATLEQEVQLPVKAGEKFVAEVWMRAAKPPSELESAGLVGTSLRIGGLGGGGGSTNGPPVPSDTEWTRITAVRTAQSNQSSLYFEFRLQQSGNPASQGNIICVYVDDAVVRRME